MDSSRSKQIQSIAVTTRASPCRRPRRSLAAGSMGSSSQEPLGFSQAAGRTSSSSLSSGRDRRREGKLKMKATIESLQLELSAQTALVAQLGTDLEHCRYKLALSIQREAAISAASDAAVAATIRLRFDAYHAGIVADAVQRALHNLAAADSYKLISMSPGAEAVASAADDVGDSGLVTFPGSEAVASEADDLGYTGLVLDLGDKQSTSSDDGALGHGGTIVPFFDAKLDMGEPLPKTDTPPECFAIFDAIADEAVSVLPYEDMPASGPDTAAGCGTATKLDEPSLATSRTGVGSSPTTLSSTPGSSSPGSSSRAAKDFNSQNLANTFELLVDGVSIDDIMTCCPAGPIKANEPPAMTCSQQASVFAKNDNTKMSSYCESPQTQCGPSATVLDNIHTQTHFGPLPIQLPGSEAMASGATGGYGVEQKVRRFPGSEAMASGANGVDKVVLMVRQLPGSEALASGAAGVDDVEQKDFCSPSLASTCGAGHALHSQPDSHELESEQCGRLPLHASPRAFDAISSDFNSQHLANGSQTLAKSSCLDESFATVLDCKPQVLDEKSCNSPGGEAVASPASGSNTSSDIISQTQYVLKLESCLSNLQEIWGSSNLDQHDSDHASLFACCLRQLEDARCKLQAMRTR